jgi:hypothetical protein
VHCFLWRRLFVGSLWICVPSLSLLEASALQAQLHAKLDRGAYATGVREMVSDSGRLRALLDASADYVFDERLPIQHVPPPPRHHEVS